MAMKRITDLDALPGALNPASLLEIETPGGASQKVTAQNIADLAVPAVDGPAVSVDGGVALFDGITGALLKDGGVLGTAAFAATSAFDAAGLAAAAETSAKAYADGLVVGLLDDRGNYDASTNAWPASGGSGTAGAIMKGDLWTVSVGGTLGSIAVTPGDLVRALVDTPGTTAGNWAITATDLGYVAENTTNKVVGISGASTDTQYPSAKLLYDQLALKQPANISATHRALGRNTAGSGNAEEVTLSQMLDWIGSAADGDILYRTGGAWARLPVGTDTHVLTLTAGLPGWAAGGGGGGGGMTNPMTTAGDTIYGGVSGAPTRLAKGASGTRLTMGATYPSWVAPNFTEAKSTASPNASANAYSLTPIAGPNSDLCLVPLGSGALCLAVPNSSTSGGNKRGLNAVDLTTLRYDALNVASGPYSWQIGVDCRASGTASGAAGYTAMATGNYSFALGKSATAAGDNSIKIGEGTATGDAAVAIGQYSSTAATNAVAIGYNAYAGGAGAQAFSCTDDTTNGLFCWGSEYGGRKGGEWLGVGETTNATALRLSSNGYATSDFNYLKIPTDKCQHVRVVVMARQTAGTGTGTCDSWTGELLIKNIGGTVSMQVAPTVVAMGSSGWTVTMTADNTLKGLNVSVTGAASKTIVWSCRASILHG